MPKATGTCKYCSQPIVMGNAGKWKDESTATGCMFNINRAVHEPQPKGTK